MAASKAAEAAAFIAKVKAELADQETWFDNCVKPGKDSESTLQLLVERGINVNSSKEGYTGLHFACLHGHVPLVQFLLKQVAIDVEVRDNDGSTPLMVAAQNGHDLVVYLLLNKGAQVDAQDNQGFTALMAAAQDGHGKCVKVLLEKGANVALFTAAKLTALDIALDGKQEGVAVLLQKYGATKTTLLN